MPAALPPDVFLDDDGLLRRGARWVAIPAGLVMVVQLLLDQAGAAVSVEDVIAAYVACGGTAHRSSVRTALTRLRRAGRAPRPRARVDRPAGGGPPRGRSGLQPA